MTLRSRAAAGVPPARRRRRTCAAPACGRARRRPRRRRFAHALRDRRVDLPGRAAGGPGPRVRRRRACRVRRLPRARRAGAPARCGQLAMRPDRRRRTGHRRQQAPRPHSRIRRRGPDRHRRAGAGARRPQCLAAAAGPVVPRRRQHLRAMHAGRHGGQQFLRVALAGLRQHGPQRRRDRRKARRRHRSAFHRGGQDAGLAATPARARRRAARHRRARARRDRARRAQAAAPRRRLQRRRLQSAERASLHRRRQRQPRAPAGRQRRDPRMDAGADARPRSPAAASHARRGQFRHAAPGDGLHPPPRAPGSVRSRARRPHDDRPRAGESRVPAGDHARADRRAGGDPSGRIHRRRCGRSFAEASATSTR